MFKYCITLLAIEWFRCIQDAEIQPNNEVNFLYGGNDTGKTTALNAIALAALLDDSIQLQNSDFYLKDVGEGFQIGLTIACKSISSDTRPGEPEYSSPMIASNHTLISNSGDADKTIKQFNLEVQGTKALELKYTVSEIFGMNQSEVETVLNAFAETRIIGYAKSGDHLFKNADLKNTVYLERDSADTSKVEYLVKSMGYVPLSNQSVRIGDLNKSFRGINLPLIGDTSEHKVLDGSKLADLQLSGGRQEIEFPVGNFGIE